MWCCARTTRTPSGRRRAPSSSPTRWTRRALLKRPRNEVAAALSRLHTRLLTCQLSQEDLSSLRDRVLMPSLAEESDPARLDDILGLVALLPPTPEDKTDPAPHKAWHAA